LNSLGMVNAQLSAKLRLLEMVHDVTNLHM
jgi:hypothetical protein